MNQEDVQELIQTTFKGALKLKPEVFKAVKDLGKPSEVTIAMLLTAAHHFRLSIERELSAADRSTKADYEAWVHMCELAWRVIEHVENIPRNTPKGEGT